jgi:hypothetical protein
MKHGEALVVSEKNEVSPVQSRARDLSDNDNLSSLKKRGHAPACYLNTED